MNIIPLIFIFLIAFLVQYALTFKQIKGFNEEYRKLRKQGRVAIGKVKGCFRAGCIVMFSIDDSGNIIEGVYMQGVTVFAKCKPLQSFTGYNVGLVTEKDCNERKLPKPIIRAVLETSSNYRVLMSGGEIETPPSIFEKVNRFFHRKKAKA